MNAQEKIQWMTIEEAYARTLTDAHPKKIYIDIYTDWCGWCKRMDAATFSNPEVAAYMNKHFYNVKLDGEFKDPIEILGHTFNFVPNGRRGYHELPAKLMNGRLSYPTSVFLNPKFEIITAAPGYQDANGFLLMSKYIGDDTYLRVDWEDYKKGIAEAAN